MLQKENSGCSSTSIILLALAAIAAALIASMFGWFTFSKSSPSSSLEKAVAANIKNNAAEAEAAAGTIVIQSADMPRMTYRHGKNLTREHFVAVMCDTDATDLIRENFRDAAEGTTVTWRLRADNITERSGKLTGSFQIPWSIQHESYSQSSNITLNCEFTKDSRDDLLRVRRNDWVNVQGTLTFKDGPPTIKEARIVGDTPTPTAEKP